MIFNRFVYPRVTVDVLADLWVGEVIKALVGWFVVNVRAGVVLSGVQVGFKIDVVSDIAVEGLTDVNANLLVAAMNALQFAMSSPG